MNPKSSDTQSAELPANAEQTEPADLAPEGDEAQAAPEVAPEVEQPAAEIPPAGTEESLDVTPTTDTPATDAEASAAEATTPDQPETEAPAADVEQPAAETSADETPAAEAEQPAAETPADEAPAAPAAGSDAAPPADTPVSREVPAPGAGPKIIGRAEDVTPPPVPAVKQSLKDIERQQRPRRRRLNATQRHRNVFFARLNEFRRQAQPRTDHEAEMEAAEATATEAAEAQSAEATEAAVDAPAPEAPTDAAPVTDAGEAPAAADAEATVETPADADAPVTDAGEAPAAAESTDGAAAESTDGAAPSADAASTDVAAPAADAAPPAAVVQADEDEHSGEPGQKRRSTPPPPVDRARLVAAIERAGGPDAVLEALQPKRDENDQPLKWATVCADACKGLKPSDPVFSAWVRLAATPVSAIKRELGINERPDRGRGGRGGPGRGGPGRGGPHHRRDDRGGASPKDLQRPSRGGSVGANIRIIGLNDEADEKQEREARRKAEREAKRQAERDRLARLGY